MNDLVPLREAVADVRHEYRLLIRWARRWGAATGRPFDPDLLALVLAGCADYVGRMDGRWMRKTVYAVLWAGVPNWCSMNRCFQPHGVPETLWQWLHFLEATDGFSDRDEPLSQLIKPFLCYVGFDYEGRQRPQGAPRLIECECREPMTPEERHIMEQEMRAARRKPPE